MSPKLIRQTDSSGLNLFSQKKHHVIYRARVIRRVRRSAKQRGGHVGYPVIGDVREANEPSSGGTRAR
jgi:hypothetical protein